MMQQILSCDWGTSSFRLRLIDLSGNSIIAETTGNKGIAAVYNDWLQTGLPEKDRMDFYKTVLLSQIEKLPGYSVAGVPVIISGMASSSIGIKELPYGDIPFAITGDSLHVLKIPAGEKCNHEILLVSGLKTVTDAMRGEETMLTGCDIKDDDEQLIIFPGTHSKHAIVKNKILVDVKTYMTGELFELLANKSILSKSVSKNENDQYNKIFENGVKDGASGNLLNTIFHVRTAHLFKTVTAEENYHYLSGLLIGSELGQIATTGVKIHLVCGQALLDRYKLALRALRIGDNLRYSSADEALISGHCKLARHFL
jgi:2-dehydro-3-deoxygalactonokinase